MLRQAAPSDPEDRRAEPRAIRRDLRRHAELVGNNGTARAHVSVAECRCAQGQDRLSLSDQRRRRDAAVRKGVRRTGPEFQSSPRAGVFGQFGPEQCQGTGEIRHRPHHGEMTHPAAPKIKA